MIEKKGSCKEVNMKSAKNQHSSSRSIYIYIYMYSVVVSVDAMQGRKGINLESFIETS